MQSPLQNLPKPLRKHTQSFETLGQLMNFPPLSPAKYSIVWGEGGYFLKWNPHTFVKMPNFRTIGKFKIPHICPAKYSIVDPGFVFFGGILCLCELVAHTNK